MRSDQDPMRISHTHYISPTIAVTNNLNSLSVMEHRATPFSITTTNSINL
jgi:hypothetical protein